MSEKELRELANHRGDCRLGHGGEPCTCGLFDALAADPDVVAVLRWLDKQTDMLWQAVRDELENHILDEFGVCLTETGWEWTE